MMQEIQPSGTNPLRKYFRQPKLYLELPSKGKFYPEGSIDMPENGELPVFPMTAKDELTMKTPDALMNGQATVDLVKSCVPNIIDPWKMPSIDLDTILIAIRIATFGEELSVTQVIPGLNEERSFSVDLRYTLEKFSRVNYVDEIEVDNMLVKISPLTYRQFTDSSMKTFEEQRIFASVNSNTMTEVEKMEKFSTSFRKLTDLTVGMMIDSIKSITVDDNIVDNKTFIKEFIDNADKNVFSTVLDHLEAQKDSFAMEPLQVTFNEEDVANGAPKNMEIPLSFDQSNFFV
jgi:hypothetical protein